MNLFKLMILKDNNFMKAKFCKYVLKFLYRMAEKGPIVKFLYTP